jgi:hypothetical protein
MVTGVVGDGEELEEVDKFKLRILLVFYFSDKGL